ncbi:MAG: CRTAC1 family protein [Planctomycetia bacterium]|nr:CRTAC1 family protein [Planctomycetia bacterium]
MSRPLDRSCTLPELGPVDRDAGEFWVANPFHMPQNGQNLSAYERKRLYLNHRGEDFLDVSFFSKADIDSDSRSVIAADFNRDGRIDLMVGSVGGGPVRLFLNELPGKSSFVRLELKGKTSNRPAIGSRIVVETGSTNITRDVFAANGCMGQAPPETLIGVGEISQIPLLKIRWPTGVWQEFRDVPVNTTVWIDEGEPAFTVGETATARAGRP